MAIHNNMVVRQIYQIYTFRTPTNLTDTYPHPQSHKQKRIHVYIM